MNDISWFRPWTRLRTIPFEAILVGDGIYRIAPSLFVFTVEYNKDLMEDSDSPYVTILIFAPSLGAVERSLNGSLSLDTHEPLDLAQLPSIGITDWSYKGLSDMKNTFESARYNVITGEFIETSLKWKDFEFCFRENNLGVGSKPYVVRYSPNA
jgi:hypothetical protein